MTGIIKISTGPQGTTIVSKRELISFNNPILKIPTPEWDFKNPPMNIIQLCNEMVDCVKENKGLGLSCPQIGLSYRMFVMVLDKNIIPIFNPRILEFSYETELLEEGCLSFPKLRLKIRRSKNIHVAYQDYNGKHHENHFSGLTSRIFQHEVNHLDGIVFTHNCSKLKLEMAIKNSAKLGTFYKIKELI